MALTRYLAGRLRHRADPEAAHYLRTGLGIEVRAKRLAVHWAPHFEASRAAQRRWHPAKGERLAVLGAGRLFDFEPALGSRFASVRLVDADPACAAFWPADCERVIADVTGGCLDRWRAALPVDASWDETLRAVRGVPACVVAPMRDCDAILSLNLLSQLPIAWQERVEAHLTTRFGRSQVKAREDEWLAAVEPGGRLLVDSHLAMLAGSGARRVLLLTDLGFYDYSGGPRFRRGHWAAPPFTLRDGVPYAEAGVERVEECPALCGLGVPALAGYELEWKQEWLWHISPRGAERSDGGSVHHVGAFSFFLKIDDRD